jgi:hypothetical protein
MTLDELRSLPYANEGTPQEYACVPTAEFHGLLSDREKYIEMRAADDREYDERVRRERRERIATAVLSGMLATNETDTIDGYVGCALAYADALIAALDAK